MSENKNLKNEEAIEKIKELVKDIGTCMFCTNVAEMPFRTRPMATIEVDDAGNLWFFSNASSDKNDEIKNDDIVQLIYAKNSSSHFLTITGKAQLIKDKNKIEELWTPIAKAWFTEGKDDPDISVIKITPQDAYYWDTAHGKMITLLKIATSVVTGKRLDEGVQGTLKV
ncbi:MAG: pyridoxamine 5'-phosphate oxidase family protein [Ginsengibacter sp.]